MPILVISETGKPKRVILDIAFEECGLAGYEFQRTPEEVYMALRRLNALMLEEPWDKLGYTQPEYGEGSAEDASSLPNWSINTVAQYLALRIAPAMATSLPPEQRASLARSLATLQSKLATIPSMRIPSNTPVGSGNSLYWPGYNYAWNRTSLEATTPVCEPCEPDTWDTQEW